MIEQSILAVKISKPSLNNKEESKAQDMSD
jgi:hypothetical protein